MIFTSRRFASLIGMALIVSATGMTYSVPAYTQGATVLEEVVVTARKREENLQDIPDTIVALSADTIERSHIVMVRDVTARIPNVSIEESLSPTSTFIGVRGVVSTRNGEPAVAMVVDGVQISSSTEISQAFIDAERIEVLKGPQGALYGRNAIGGAILITTKGVTDELSGSVKAGYGNHNFMEFDGSLSGPITDNLKFRIAANFRDFDGTITNEFIKELADGANISSALDVSKDASSYTDFETNKDLSGRLEWTPTDSTTVDLRFRHSDLETGAYWYRPSIRMETSNDYIDFPIGNNVNSVAFRTINSGTVKIDHEMDFGTITSITNYTETEERYGVPYEGRGSDQMGDVDFMNRVFVERAKVGLDPADAAILDTQLQGVGSHNFYDISSWSQEIRLTSRDDQRLRWVGGAYVLFTDRKDTIRADLTVPGSRPLEARQPNGLPGATDFFLGGSTSGMIFETSNTQDNTAWAVFLNMDYDITDKLTLTAGIRYDEDKREITRLDGPTVNTNGQGIGLRAFGAGDCTVGVGGCVPRGFVEKATFRSAQPKASLAYRPVEDLMLYTTYARGFRSGGFNASGALLAETYDKEILDSFEVGLKSTLLDGSLRVNAAAFYQDYDNVQVFEFDGAIFVQSLFNIPKSEIYGAELSLDWAATDTLTLSGGVGILESKIKQFDSSIRDTLESELNARITNTVKLTPDSQAAFDRNFEGNKLPKFPHLSANASLLHEMPIPWFGGSTLITRLDYRTFGDRYWWVDNTDKQDFEHILDGSIGLQINDNWEGRIWCKNCTDTFYDYSMEPAEMVLFGGPSKDIFYQARERTFGVEVKYSF
ncbi:MAG: TonB-dependent receptor [Gammaproteobacteria bacterium]